MIRVSGKQPRTVEANGSTECLFRVGTPQLSSNSRRLEQYVNCQGIISKDKMNKIDVYRKSIDNLEKVIAVFEEELEKPEFMDGAFMYKSPTVKQVCLLKAVRIISGLNALLLLLKGGYVTEMGVLMRTIGDCINDIYFLLEHFPDKTPEVERYISNFFNEIIEEPEIVENEKKKVYRTKARKIHASRARLLSEHMNFPVDKDMVYRIYSAYSGYVHAAYPNIMELYGGSAPYKFHLRGMKGTPRIRDWEAIFTALIRSATLVLGYMAEKYDKGDLIQQIRSILDWFEKETTHIKKTGI